MKDLQQKETYNSFCDKDYKDFLELVHIFINHNTPLNNIYILKQLNGKIKEINLTL